VRGGIPTFAAIETQPPEWQRLRDAILELNFRREYAELELAEVLTEADVSEGQFHRLFGDFEDCYCGIYVVERDRIMAEINAAVDQYSAWRDRVRASAYAIWRAVSDDLRITNFIFAAARNAGERALREVEVGMRGIYDLLDEGRRQPGSRAQSRATAESIGGSIWNQIAAAVSTGAPMEERVVRYLMYAAVMPYLGTEAAEEELEMPPARLPPR
jgi:AcrR family transcriptional regulator